MNQSLTKEFWDEMEQKYPKASDHFSTWLNAYKIANYWDSLFFEGTPNTGNTFHKASTYYELPIAFQFGIFVQYSGSVIIAYKLAPSDAKMESQDLEFELKELVNQCFNWLELKGNLP